MARPTEADLEQYQAGLIEIGERISAANWLLDQTDLRRQRVGWAALELRMVLELVVLGSLSPNRAAIARVSSVFKIRDAGEARNTVRAVNPRYWPVAIMRNHQDGRTFAMSLMKSGFLTESEWGRE